ncbi:MAG: Ig-like domain-containing protein, partial [Desulfobacteraceae bacterium]|nr:Ig-like domain-containing protein [Desulfobacteraceae bacterium]
PRPVWAATKVGDNVNGTLTGVGTNNPTHMACENCHVRFTGSAGNYTMTVNKFTRTSYTSMATAWTTTAVHTFTGLASNQINSYGACFGCHDGVTTVRGTVAPNVQVWHARPDRFGGTGWTIGTSNGARGVPNTGTAWYAAGRSSSGIGNMNLWFGTGKSGNTSGYSGYQKLSGSYKNTNRNNLSTYNTSKSAAFLRITVPTVAGKDAFSSPQTSPTAANTYSVPVFAQVAQATGTSYAEPDYVSVSSAVYDGTNITVTATHTVGACSTLTAAYGTVTGAMSGTGTCTATLSGATYPTGGSTVNVTSSNSPAINVTGYRITDPSTNQGVFGFSAATYSVQETAGTVSITVNRTTGNMGAASVNYTTSDGTGVAGANYTATSGTLNWAAGDMSAKVFTIPIINDNVANGNMTVNITLSGAIGASLGTPSAAVLTIVDVPPYQQPVAVNDAYTVTTGSTTALALLTNDTEPNTGYTLSISSVTTPTGGTASVLVGNTQVQYIAPATAGTYTFTYTITDQGGGTSTATVTMTVVAQVTNVTQWTARGVFITSFPAWQNFTAGSGSNRLMLVAVHYEYGSSFNPTLTVKFGSSTITQIAQSYSTSNGRDNVWIGYLNEAGIASHGTDQITASFSSNPSSAWMEAAVYSNVNQTTPIASSVVNQGNSSSPSFSGLAAAANGYAIYAITNNNASSSTSFSAPTGYTEHIDISSSTSSYFACAVGSKAIGTSASTEGYTFTVSNDASSGSQYWGVVGVALNHN